MIFFFSCINLVPPLSIILIWNTSGISSQLVLIYSGFIIEIILIKGWGGVILEPPPPTFEVQNFESANILLSFSSNLFSTVKICSGSIIEILKLERKSRKEREQVKLRISKILNTSGFSIQLAVICSGFVIE